MKKLLFAILLLTPSAFATNWYVRTDGGTPYSATNTAGRCNGQANAPDPGSGTNQACAVNNLQALWADGVSGTRQWIIAGGDTVYVEAGTYREGWQTSDGSTTPNCAGDQFGCSMPPPPNGTSTNPTQFIGVGTPVLHGGYGVETVWQLRGASYISISGFEVTDYSSCGQATQVHSCVAGTDDYAKNGIEMNNAGCHITLSNLNIHGMADAGVFGTTCWVTATDVTITGVSVSGWNLDDGGGASSTITGTNTITRLTIQYAGCAEQYPLVYPAANSIGDCTDDNGGGYGDGVGTNDSSNIGSIFDCEQCTFRYNTQDGLDLLHFNEQGICNRCLAYGNMGNQIKTGGTGVIITNSVINGNCFAMHQAAFGPFTSNFSAHLTDYCRAGGSALVIRADDSFSPVPQVHGNTISTASGLIGMEVAPLTSCSSSTCAVNLSDNVFLNFTNSIANGNPSGDNKLGVSVYLDNNGAPFIIPPAVFTNTGGSYSYNADYYIGATGTCPTTTLNETNALCADPGLTDETWHNTEYGNVAPINGSSAVVGSGIAVSGLTADYNGATRPSPPSPPSMGAYEYITNIIRHLFSGSSAISGSGSIN